MVPILSSTRAFLNVPRCLRASASDGGAARSVSVMAELKTRLRADLTDAMKAKDKLRTATLRMLLAAIQTEEVSGKQARELSDDEVLKVLAKEARKRGEAAEIYTQNGRGELAANEHAEARVIDEYLPTPLTDAELADVADTAMAQVAEELGERPGMKQMGMVMKAATALAAGKADGARLSKAVKDRLYSVVCLGGARVSESYDTVRLYLDDRAERPQRAVGGTSVGRKPLDVEHIARQEGSDLGCRWCGEGRARTAALGAD